MTTLLPKEIAEFVKANILGCKFVGISSEQEVFLEFDHDDFDLENAAAARLRQAFPIITRITSVVRPNTQQLTEMVASLNEFLGEEKSPSTNLLTIQNF